MGLIPSGTFSNQVKKRVSGGSTRKAVLEELEQRWNPVTINSWKPGNVNILWSNPNNWTQGHVPTNSEQVDFDGSLSNTSIEIDTTAKVGSVVFQNHYTSIFEIEANVTVEAVNQIDLSNGGSTTDVATVDFDATSSKLQMDGANSTPQGTFGNIKFIGQNGTVYVQGGTLNLTNTQGSSSNASFLVLV
jgi:hypothetical protein